MQLELLSDWSSGPPRHFKATHKLRLKAAEQEHTAADPRNSEHTRSYGTDPRTRLSGKHRSADNGCNTVWGKFSFETSQFLTGVFGVVSSEAAAPNDFQDYSSNLSLSFL